MHSIEVVEDGNAQGHDKHMNKETAVREYRRQLYDKFKNNITLHGYRQLSLQKGWRKLSWMLVMTLLTLFSVHLSYHMVRDFGYQTALEYEQEDGVSYLNYPTITICANSPVYSPRSFKKFPLNITLQEFKTFYLENLSSVSYTYNTSTTSKAVLKALYAINVTSYKEILKLFENTIHDSTEIWSRYYEGPACYLGERPCNLTSDFRETLVWQNSLCHQWNYYHHQEMSKQQTQIDEKLTMLLDLHAKHKLISFFPFFGITLYIHPYGSPHYLSEHTESIGVHMGLFTTIDIEITEINLLPTPYSTNCGSKNLVIIKNFPYSRALCEIDCILVKIYEKCKCLSFEFEGHVGDIPLCSVEQMKCYYKHVYAFKGSCDHYATTCPLECKYYKYQFQTSLIMNLGDEFMYQGFQSMAGWGRDREETKKNINENLLGFEIGYKSLSKRIENYVPLVTPSSLLGTLGGSIGLCLGFSFVTGFEFIMFIYDYSTAGWKVTIKNGKRIV